MKVELNDLDMEQVIGGLQISRSSETEGIVYYNGNQYPFTNYSALLSTVQSCVNSGQYDDPTLMDALFAAGVIS